MLVVGAQNVVMQPCCCSITSCDAIDCIFNAKGNAQSARAGRSSKQSAG